MRRLADRGVCCVRERHEQRDAQRLAEAGRLAAFVSRGGWIAPREIALLPSREAARKRYPWARLLPGRAVARVLYVPHYGKPIQTPDGKDQESDDSFAADGAADVLLEVSYKLV